MADFEQLKASVASIIKTNGAEAITGAVLQDVLLTIINSISDGYMFGGVAQHSGSVGNPDYNVFYLGGSGSYTGYGGSIDVPAGSYCVFAYDGTWHQSVIDLGISLGGTVSEGETQGVTGDAVNTALNTLWENITNILDSIVFSDDTSELYKGDRITQGMRVTAGGVERLLSSFTILAATVQKAGLMSAADKRKLDNFVLTVQDMIETMTVSDVTEAGDTGTRIDESIEWTVDEVTHQIATFTLLAATAVKAGLMSNTDKQAVDALFTIEAEDTTAVDDLGVKLTETLNWTVNNVSQIFAEFTLLVATQSKAGLMSAADKVKLDAYENNIRSMEIVDTTGNADKGNQITETLRWVFGGVSTVITTFTLLAATHTKAGLMSAIDKQLVDALLTIIAQDTTAQADEKTSMTQSLKWTRGGTQQTMVSFSILAATAAKAGLMSADDKAKLDAMLTGGYMFAGVATTSTNPTTGTEKMFYIAIEAGEYTHFDGLTVDRGINILMYDGSDWNAVTVVGIDDKPTAGSNNLVESEGVFSANQDIKSSIGEARSIAEGYIPMTPFEVVDGKAINGSGEETTNAKFDYWKYAVQPDHVYFVSAKFNSTNLHIWTVFYFDANNNYISSSKAFEFNLDSENPEGSIHNAATTSPANAAYMYVNVQKVLKDATFVNDVPSALTDTKTSLIQKAFGMDVLDVVNNSYYSRSSGIKGVNLSVLVKCKVNPNSKYPFKITIPANSSASFYLISYLDANGDYISGVSPSYRSDASASVSFDTVITTSPTCRYVYINVPKVALDSLEFGYKDLAEIEEEDVLEPIYNVCTPSEEVEGYFISTPAEGQTEPRERENANSKYSKYTLDPSKRYAVDYSIAGTFTVYALYFVDGNGDYISRFLVNNTGTKITGNNLAVPIPENADKVYINGAISDSSWIKLKEVSTTDRTSDILGKLRKFGTCKLVSGDYYINGLVMPNDTTLQGEGKATKLIMSGSSDGYAIRLGARCTIQDLWLDGNDDLTYKGEDNIDIESIDMDGNRHGILLLGDTTDAYAGATVTRCEITNFTGGGITCDNTGYGVYSSLTVSDTWIRKCCVGVNIAYFSEFNKFVNVGCWGCRYGCVNNGGNNLFSNVNFSYNSINYYMNGDEGKCVRYDGTTENGKNMGHGSMVNATLVHAGKSNDDPAYAVVIINIDPGFVISGVDGGYGKYYIRGSRNIMLNNLRLGHASGFELINMDWPLIISNSLGIIDAFTPFVVTQNDVPVTDWDADGNGGKVYMYGCFVASSKATPQYLASL